MLHHVLETSLTSGIQVTLQFDSYWMEVFQFLTALIPFQIIRRYLFELFQFGGHAREADTEIFGRPVSAPARLKRTGEASK